MEKYSDEELIRGLREEDSKIVDFIYDRYRPIVFKCLSKRNVDCLLQEDCFQEGFIEVFVKAKKNKLKVEKSFLNFFITACMNKWKKKVRDEIREKEFAPLMSDPGELEEPNVFPEENYNPIEDVAWRVFKTLKERCQMIINLILKKFNRREISEIVNLNYSYTRFRTSRCYEYWRERVMEDPEVQNYLNNL